MKLVADTAARVAIMSKVAHFHRRSTIAMVLGRLRSRDDVVSCEKKAATFTSAQAKQFFGAQ